MGNTKNTFDRTRSQYSASFDSDARKAKQTREIFVEYDFTDVSQKELRELALKTLNIRHKSWVVSKAATSEQFLEMDIEREVNVRELLDRAKSREALPPEAVASRSIGKINDAEKLAELIATMEAKLKQLQ